jgi:two-component system, NtrC family, sensor kinase
VLLTRSIRRKMATGLAALLLTLALLSYGGIAGLSKYRRMVKDLDASISQAPRNSDLAATIGSLIQPLAHPFPEVGSRALREQFCRRQQTEFQTVLQHVKQDVERHFDRLNAYLSALRRSKSGVTGLRSGPAPHYQLHARIRENLDRCQGATRLLADPDKRGDAIGYMLNCIAELHLAVNNVPDPALDHLRSQLIADMADYHWHLGVVRVSSIVAAVMFAVLVYYAYQWVIVPIYELQRGACRVAAGDFDYRIELATGDEMSTLADAFNHMTERFQSVTEDLDKRVQQQTQQLVQSARLAGVGFLAAGVAHEINNPLHAIATAAEGLEWRLAGQLDHLAEADRAVVKEYIAMMQTESARCREITEKLLDFARGKGSEKNQYDITAIVDDTVSVLEHVGKFRDRTIRFDATAEHYAHVNGSEIKQVVLNLVANALEAIDPGGEVRIGIRETPDCVEVTCQDNGCGMTPEVLDHIFDPFFSTKQNTATAKGTGLGLSISHRIVQDHHGSLEATSDGPGQGSTFRLRLPKRPRRAQAA